MTDKVNDARELFGDFSGHLLDQEFDLDLQNMVDKDNGVIFAFGRLDALEGENGDTMEFAANDAPLICSSHDGEQLHIVGGNYEAPDLEPIPIYAVEYSTYRDNKFEQYRHEFDRTDLPVLNFDLENDEMFFTDGRYTFTDRGIENS